MTPESQKPAESTARETVEKPSLLMRIRNLFQRTREGQMVVPTSTPATLTGTASIARTRQPFELRLGKAALEFHLDLPIAQDDGREGEEWIVHRGPSYFNGVPEFLRIRSGEAIVLGRADALQGKMFKFDQSVADRHVRIANSKGNLTIQVLDPDRQTKLSAVSSPRRLWSARHDNLKRLPAVIGRQLVEFDDESALDAMREVNGILSAEAYRERNDEGEPGGIIKFPDKMTVVVMGDVHAQADNILRVVSEGGLLETLERGEACLVFLGDLVHDEGEGQLDQMDTSIFVLDLFCMLKRRFPKNIFYLHGNHESFSPEVGKGGVPQGMLLRRHLKKRRGTAYVKEVETLFEKLAYIVQGNNFAGCHGAPTHSKVTREALINICHYPGLQSEIIWNRLRQPNRPGGYGKGAVKRFRRTLHLPAEATVLVGHTPMSPTETLWLNIGGIEGHHIVYSAHRDRLAAVVLRDGFAVPMEFNAESTLALLNAEPDPSESAVDSTPE